MQQQRCALLPFVIGILLVTASCGDKMVVPTSGAAGKVIDARGQVKAKRGSEPARPLQTGDTVYVKDTVSTSAESSVSIELTHNRAIWTLDSNQESSIEQSLAWTLARRKASVFANNEKIGNSAAASDHGNTAGATADTLQPPSATAEAEVTPRPEVETNDSDTPATTAAADETPEPLVPDPGLIGEGSNKPTRRSGGKTRGIKTGNKSGGGSVSGIFGAPVDVPGGGEAGGEGVDPAPNPKPLPPPPGPSKRPKPRLAMTAVTPLLEVATKKLVRDVAKRCHKGSELTGDLKYELTAEDGKITKFTTSPVGSLSPIAKCMKDKLLQAQVTGSGKLEGKISF